MDYKTVQVVSLRLIKEKEVCFEHRITNPNSLATLVEPFFEGLDREHFIVVGIDGSNFPTILNIAAVGGNSSCNIDTACVFKPLIISNSVSFITAHNHPSGTISPSKADITVTKRLRQAGEIIGIKLIDHLILGHDKAYRSLMEMSLI